jgi:hypothetical protein
MLGTGMNQGYVPMAPMMGQGPLLSAAGVPTSTLLNGGDAGQRPMNNVDGVQGTLGLTYQLPSKNVNSTKHPRVGLLEISVHDDAFRSLNGTEEIKITVEDEAGHFDELEGYFGSDDKWHFESEPLYSGVPHIYDVKFEIVRTDKKRERKGDKTIEMEVEQKVRDIGLRRVRLIPGRTVQLSYP